MKNFKTMIFNITALSILMLFMNSAVAQVQEKSTSDTTKWKKQSQSVSQDQNQRTYESKDQEMDKGVDYSKEINKNQLPQEVTGSLDKLYPAHDIEKVYRGEDDSFKVKVKNESDEAVVYYNSGGDFLRAHNLSDLKGATPQEQSQKTQEERDKGKTNSQMNRQKEWKNDKTSTENRKGSANAQEQNQQSNIQLEAQMPDEGVEYTKKINKKELSKEVNKSIDDLYPAYEITEVYRGEDDSYKVKVNKGSNEALVYYDSDGKFMRAHDMGSFKQKQGQMNQKSQATMNDRNQDSQKASSMKQNQKSGDEAWSKADDKGVDYSKEIDKKELPKDVTGSLDELYPAHDIEKVYRGKDDSFKVKVKNETDEAVVYYNSEGDFLRAKNVNNMQQSASPQQQGQRTMENQNQDKWGKNDQTGTKSNSRQGQMKEATSAKDKNQRGDEQAQLRKYDKGVNYSEEINKDELPSDVTSSLDELYPAHDVKNVFRGEDDSYKVRVKNEDDEAVVYYSSEGDFLRAENLTGLQQEGVLPQEQSQKTQESQNQWGTQDRNNQHESQRSTDSGDRMNSGMQDQDMHRGSGHGTMGKGYDDKDDQRSTGTGSNQQGTTGSYDRDRSQSQRGTMNNESSSYPQVQSQRGTDDDRMGSRDFDKGVDFSETVEESELPQEVSTSLDELYPKYEIEEIQRGDDDSYKVKVKNQDDVVFVYYNSEGDFLRSNNQSDTSYGVSPQQKSHRMSGTQDKNQWHSEYDKNTEGASATPQEQSQRTQEKDNLAMQGERRTDSEWGADNPAGTRANRTGSNPERTDNQYGTAEDDTTLNGTVDHDTVAPQEQYQITGGDNMKYNEEIQEDDLPELITNSLDELYPDYDVKQAYRADDGSYKVKIEKQDDKVAVFYDSSGYFVEDEKKNDTKNTNEDW